MEAAPPADDVTAGREVLTTPVSTTAERSGWPGGRARSSPRWAAARVTCSILADAGTVIRRPIDPANRGRVHAHAAEAPEWACRSVGGRWLAVAMAWETHPLTPDRFEDFADVINTNRRANHCWCLSHRLQAKEIAELGGTGPDAREQAMRRLCEDDHPPGVVTYLDGEPVGWCNIGPRSEITRLSRSRLIRPVDDMPVWSIVCVVVRSGWRKRGVTGPLIEGAVAYAASHGAPAVEAHPVDPEGRMDLTMAFVGTRAMFEKAGFRVVGTTDAVASGMPRLTMRRDLT